MRFINSLSHSTLAANTYRKLSTIYELLSLKSEDMSPSRPIKAVRHICSIEFETHRSNLDGESNL